MRIIIIYLLSMQCLFAQKYDNIYIFGNEPTDSAINAEINFQTGVPILTQTIKPIGFDGCNAAICDSLGNLSLYTNGYSLYNRNNQMLQNGNYMCPSNTCYTSMEQIGYTQPQTYLFLPKGNNNQKQYYLFQEVLDWVTLSTGGVTIRNSKLLYNEIDMSIGVGLVTKKHQICISDTLSNGVLTAIKHANGKDWWIIMPRSGTDTYYRVLVTTDSVYPPQSQRPAPILPYYHGGFASFSPDGKKYIIYGWYFGEDRLYIYDFDRCTGLLSNLLVFQLYPIYTGLSASVSPNSKYLYVSMGDKIDQYDISLPNSSIESSKITVWQRDTSYTPSCGQKEFAANGVLAPDNKIYFIGDCFAFYTIQNPDNQGLACNVQKVTFPIPYTIYQRFSFTNYPNFRLGAEPCYPTEIVKEEGIRKEVSVYPNPTSGVVQLRLSIPTRARTRLYVWDMYGREVANYEIAENTREFEFDTQKWAEGVYYFSLSGVSGKLVVSR